MRLFKVKTESMNMKNILSCLPFVGLLFASWGCDHSGPIEVYREEIRQPMEVTILTKNDTLLVAESSFNVTGLLNDEENNYPATLLVNGITSNLGDSNEEYSYSRVVVRDKSAPVPITGRFGQVDDYQHLDVGKVGVNGTTLDRAEAIIQIRSITLIPVRVGIFYKLVKDKNQQSSPFEFRPNSEFAFNAEGKDNIGTFIKRINSPDKIKLTTPKPNGLLFFDEDMTLRWQGRSGQRVAVVFSLFDDEQKTPGKPLLKVMAQPQSNALLIPAKILQLLPKASSGHYVITIVSANRSQEQIPGYAGKVLIQSSSIHNITVSLR